MMLKAILLSIVMFYLGVSNAYGLGINVEEISYEYEASLDSQYVIGAMPKVVLIATDNGNTIPGVRVCGKWYRGDQVANAPNVAQPQSAYCRTTDENGSTFFRYRDRFSTRYPIATWDTSLVDLSQRNIRFNIISFEYNGNTSVPSIPFIFVGY